MKINMKWSEFSSWLMGGFIGILILLLPHIFLIILSLVLFAIGDEKNIIYETVGYVLWPFLYISDKIYSFIADFNIPGVFFIVMMIYFCLGSIAGKNIGNFFSRKLPPL